SALAADVVARQHMLQGPRHPHRAGVVRQRCQTLPVLRRSHASVSGSESSVNGLAPGEMGSTMPSILFVCTGNIFRSMTAEYALKAALEPQSPLQVSSAGTQAIPQEMHPDVCAYLVRRGIDPSSHQQRKVSAELLRDTDLAIAMSLDHQVFLFESFGH